jgi:hypothetical protein
MDLYLTKLHVQLRQVAVVSLAGLATSGSGLRRVNQWQRDGDT